MPTKKKSALDFLTPEPDEPVVDEHQDDFSAGPEEVEYISEIPAMRTLEEFVAGKKEFEITQETLKVTLRLLPAKRAYTVVVCDLDNPKSAGAIASRAEYLLSDAGFLLTKMSHHALTGLFGPSDDNVVEGYYLWQLLRGCD